MGLVDVWSGVQMLSKFLRQAAFWASLLLSLCILDGTFISILGTDFRGSGDVETATSGPARTHSLSVTVSLSPSKALASPDLKITLKIYREQISPEATSFPMKPRYEFALERALEATKQTEYVLPEGTYWVLVRADGFARVAERVKLEEARSLELELSPAGRLSVRVLAEQEGALLPLARATVLVGEDDALPLGAQTDEKGEALFEECGTGAQKVRIFAPGFEPYEGRAEAELVVRLRPASTLLVRVLYEGKPHAGAHVVIAGVRLWPSRTVETNADGTVRVSGLKPGSYALYAESGFLISPVSRDVQVLSEAGEREVVLNLLPGVFKQVRIQDEETDKPIAQARVTYSTSALGEFSRRGISDATGHITMGPLETRYGVLSVRAIDYVSRVLPFSEEEVNAVGPLIVALGRSARVVGRVVDERGFPVAGATVEVVGTDRYGMPVSVTSQSEVIPDAHFDWSLSADNVLIPAGELGVMLGPVPPIPMSDLPTPDHQRLFTDKKGQFVVTQVPPGDILVVARHPDYLDGKSAEFSLGPGGERNVEVVLKTGLPLRGRVLDHQGFPVAFARVRVLARGFDRRVSAESDGTFSLGAAPLDVSLTVSRAEQPLRVLLSKDVKKSEREQEVTVELQKPRESVQIVVVDDKGEEIPLAQVKVVSLDKDIPFKETGFTSDRGLMQLPEAHGLRARLSVSAPEFVTREMEQSLKAENKVILTRALSLVGRVMGVRGRLPAGGAWVKFETNRLTRTTAADEYGEFRLTGIPPGAGVLSATHDEFGTGQRAITVKSRDSEEPVSVGDLILAPALTVIGRVETPSGAGVSGVLIAHDRLSPFLPSSGASGVLGRSGADGTFEVQVPRQEGLYLYGALPGKAFGFSDQVPVSDRDAVEGVRLIIDHEDQAPADQLGTVLFGLREERGQLFIYAVARGSQAFLSGFREDDVLWAIDGHRPSDLKDARDLLSGVVGSDVKLKIKRAGRVEEVLTAREPFLRN